MKLYICAITVILACLVENNEAGGPVSFDENELFNCYYIIICDLHKPYEFRRLIMKAGPKMIEEAFVMFREISLIPDAADTEKFWNTYPEHKCNHTEEVKRQMFNDWIKKMGEYWAKVCSEDPTGIECTKAEDAAMELNAIITEYTANGSCTSSAENKGKEMAKGAESLKPPGAPSIG